MSRAPLRQLPPDRASARQYGAARRRFADRRWLDAIRADIAEHQCSREPVAARHRAHVAELIASRADRWLRSRPGLAWLADQSRLSLRTVQRYLREWERGGWLDVLEHGATPRYAPDRLNPADGNLAREWQLVIPDSGVTPTLTPTAGRPSAGAREDPPVSGTGQGDEDRRCAPDSLPAPPRWPSQADGWPLGRTAQRRREVLTLCEALYRRHMVLRRLSARRLRSILRPWIGSPWLPGGPRYSALDVLYAIEHDQQGRPHEYAGRVRDPAAWLAHRMSYWTGPDGSPCPPHSAVLAARAAEAAAVAEAARAEREAAEAARLGVAGVAARRGAALARQLAGGAFGAALERRDRMVGR